MPEGPSILLVKEAVRAFEGKKIISANGNSKTDINRLLNKKIIAFKTHGKHFLICFNEFTVRIHFLMFGSYTINERKDRPERLRLNFKNGELNFYTCSVKFLEGDDNEHYDWSADVMNDNWNPRKAKTKLKEHADAFICDVLLEQEIFAGVGNIIKNEILYRVHVHPESITGNIPANVQGKIIRETRGYSFEFLKWKRNYELKKHLLAYSQKTCKRCNLPFVKKSTGLKKRRSFFCTNCQERY